MSQTIFALIDCDNFFVSCELLFRPDLEDRPVVVLSNNDGCAVSRSREAKAIGIPMGAPVFKYRDLFERHRVVKFSANFELYGDISRRVTSLLTSVTPKIEVYSIDESFLDLSELPIKDYDAWARRVRQNILDWIGVPVSIGIAPSKTLAKAAVARAKKDPALGGVLNLYDVSPRTIDTHLKQLPIGDVWGVGRRLAPKLRAEGVSSALHLKHMLPRHAQQLLGIHGRHMVAELNGESCYPLEREERVRKSIARTRTFGEDTASIDHVQAALANFVNAAAFRLRTSGLVTRRLSVFAMTHKHKPGFTTWSRQTYFEIPTADTGFLITQATQLLQEFYQSHYTYHRAGVLLWDFLPEQHLQTDIFGVADPEQAARTHHRMRAVDMLNERFGKRAVHYAAEDLGSAWQSKRLLQSPRYVSSWEELPLVKY